MSFKTLVTKLKKGGKSTASAKNIAGAVANKKRKGGGTGPTNRQKKTMTQPQIAAANKTMAANKKKKSGSATKMGKAYRGKLA